jgi:hypothetical protein
VQIRVAFCLAQILCGDIRLKVAEDSRIKTVRLPLLRVWRSDLGDPPHREYCTNVVERTAFLTRNVGDDSAPFLLPVTFPVIGDVKRAY